MLMGIVIVANKTSVWLTRPCPLSSLFLLPASLFAVSSLDLLSATRLTSRRLTIG